MDSEKIWHGGTAENCAVGWKIFCDVHVLHYDLPGPIDVIAVSALNVCQVFLSNPEFTRGRVMAFSTGRDRRNGDDLIAPIKRSALLLEIYDDTWLAAGSGIIPIGNLVAVFSAASRKGPGWSRRRFSVSSTTG
jgi:hypothetical protein